MVFVVSQRTMSSKFSSEYSIDPVLVILFDISYNLAMLNRVALPYPYIIDDPNLQTLFD